MFASRYYPLLDKSEMIHLILLKYCNCKSFIIVGQYVAGFIYLNLIALITEFFLSLRDSGVDNLDWSLRVQSPLEYHEPLIASYVRHVTKIDTFKKLHWKSLMINWNEILILKYLPCSVCSESEQLIIIYQG